MNALTDHAIALIEAARDRGCFMCKWTLEEMAGDGTLQPKRTRDGEVLYPVEAQVKHIQWEAELHKRRKEE
jgi:hypothetical protein